MSSAVRREANSSQQLMISFPSLAAEEELTHDQGLQVPLSD